MQAGEGNRLQQIQQQTIRTMEADLRALGVEPAPAPTAPAPPAAPVERQAPKRQSAMQRMLHAGATGLPHLILGFWTTLGLAVLAGVAWAWFSLVPRMWAAGVAGGFGLWTVPAAVGVVLVAVLPVGAAFGTWQKVARVYRDYIAGRASLLDVQRATAATGLEAAMRQVARDLGGMGTLLHWSQRELAAYHQDALVQKKRAFRNAMVATWLGFALLLVGAVPMLLPSAAPLPSDPDRNGLVVVAGVVTNAVGVMFYFMYRDSQARATEYYDRQRFGHHVAMCYLMARDLRGPAYDDAVNLILREVLERDGHGAAPGPTARWRGRRTGDDRGGRREGRVPAAAPALATPLEDAREAAGEGAVRAFRRDV